MGQLEQDMFGKLDGEARSDIEMPMETLARILKLAHDCETQSPLPPAQDNLAPASADRTQRDVAAELSRAIANLSDDQQAVLVAMTWIGSGRYGATEFDLALTHAFSRRGPPTPDFLQAMPGFAAALERGASYCGAELDDETTSAVAPNGSYKRH